MKTYDQAIKAAEELYSGTLYSNMRSSVSNISAILLAEIYGVSQSRVFRDIKVLVDAREKARRDEAKARHRAENERRQALNLERKAKEAQRG